MVVAHGREVVEAPRRQREGIVPLPDAVAFRSLHAQRVPAIHHPIPSAVMRPLDTRPQAKGLQERVSESHFCKPRFLQVDPQHKMIELGTIAVIFTWHAGREQTNLKPDCTQQGCKSSIEFVAEAATTPLHDLVDEGILLAHDLSARSDIEVLKGDTEQVSSMQIAQHCKRGRKRSGVRDSVEIGRDVEHGGLPSCARPDSRGRLSPRGH